jgi:hypothetical protein
VRLGKLDTVLLPNIRVKVELSFAISQQGQVDVLFSELKSNTWLSTGRDKE